MKKLSFFIITLACAFSVMAQNKIPLIGSPVPQFEANSTNGILKFPEDFGHNWKILFSHPADFTPVCTTEIMQLARMQKEFKALNVQIAVISSDNLSLHFQWKQAMENYIQKNGEDIGKIEFPFIEDTSKHISTMYGMFNPADKSTRDIRGVFIIDPDNIVQSINFYPRNVGRNLEEIKRTLIALQTSKLDNVLMPVNWKPGNDVLVESHPNLTEGKNENPDQENLYYMAGLNLWYKKVNSDAKN